jgi:hypothetical protein
VTASHPFPADVSIIEIMTAISRPPCPPVHRCGDVSVLSVRSGVVACRSCVPWSGHATSGIIPVPRIPPGRQCVWLTPGSRWIRSVLAYGPDSSGYPLGRCGGTSSALVTRRASFPSEPHSPSSSFVPVSPSDKHRRNRFAASSADIQVLVRTKPECGNVRIIDWLRP